MRQIANPEPIGSGNSHTLSWESGLSRIAKSQVYSLATSSQEGRPHVTPVLAVLCDGHMHFATGSGTRKSANLRSNPLCVLSASSGDFDLVLEGRAELVRDDALLHLIASVFEEKYGWSVTVRDGSFQDTEGAPTAGPPPYNVYAIDPEIAFAFGAANETQNGATRWTFS